MKILFLNTSQHTGGAAIAAQRLAEALRTEGVGVEVLTLEDKDWEGSEGFEGSEGSEGLKRDRISRRRALWLKAWERFVIWCHAGFSRRNLWKVSLANTGVDVTETRAFKDADIIHLHWVNQGFLSLAGIERIVASGKPVVWTMHDMWPLTGICHHAHECRGYEEGCNSCPFLRGSLASKVFGQKAAIWQARNLHFVGVSSWLRDKATSSKLMEGKEMAVIPNVISLEAFRRLDKVESRLALGLPTQGNILVMGAARIDDPIKGVDLLIAALEKVATERVVPHLVLFGQIKSGAKALLSRIPVPCTYLGSIDGAEQLSRIYSAADVCVSSSLYETFGQTLVEAMACGCMPVSFDEGGQTDIIQHQQTGYLARRRDTDDLAAGICWALDEGRYRITPEALREHVCRRFAARVVARQYVDFYTKISKN